MRALNALRLEKGFGSWAREYRPIYGPVEAGLGRFVALENPADFIGKAAAAGREGGGRQAAAGQPSSSTPRTPTSSATSRSGTDGAVVGWVTSGGYAHATQTSVALGYVPKEIAGQDDGWTIELLGEKLPARRLTAPLFDANGSRMRS